MIDVHDIIIHTPTIEAQRVYRVTAIRLGGRKEEGFVELQPLGYSTEYPIRVPHMMLDDMERSGVIVVGWRLRLESAPSLPNAPAQPADQTGPQSPPCVAGSAVATCSIPPWVHQMMNPSQWTQRQSAAWHRNIPDVRAAFAALLEESNAKAQPADQTGPQSPPCVAGSADAT